MKPATWPLWWWPTANAIGVAALILGCHHQPWILGIATAVIPVNATRLRHASRQTAPPAIITWAFQSRPDTDQPWQTHALNIETSRGLTEAGCNITDPRKLARQLADRHSITADSIEHVQARGPLRIAVWAGEDHAGEPDGAYGSLDALGVTAN